MNRFLASAFVLMLSPTMVLANDPVQGARVLSPQLKPLLDLPIVIQCSMNGMGNQIDVTFKNVADVEAKEVRIIGMSDDDKPVVAGTFRDKVRPGGVVDGLIWTEKKPEVIKDEDVAKANFNSIRCLAMPMD